ncbi:MAG: T6SS effector amidase Tae4 family protein, partial [Flavobacterium sp.]
NLLATYMKAIVKYPNMTKGQFENWFITPREGVDATYDAAFWENPNLSFPHQELPGYKGFDDAYPKTDGAQLANLVGGEVLNLYNKYPSVVRGFCALKVSRALNYSGIIIPEIKTTKTIPGTVMGADGKYYFLNAKSLNIWMQKTFGVSPQNSNHIRILGTEGGVDGTEFPKLTAGIKGIYSMVSYIPNWASGHADLINNSNCVFGCHFSDIPAAPIDYIDIWKLN